jgi:hypothetical protein
MKASNTVARNSTKGHSSQGVATGAPRRPANNVNRIARELRRLAGGSVAESREIVRGMLFRIAFRLPTAAT